MMPETNSLADAESQLESARSQLVQQLRAGQPCHAEDLFSQYPVLLERADLALELICTEFTARLELGQQTSLDEWYRRFPQWREQLHQRFEVYNYVRDLGPAQTDGLPTAAYTPTADEELPTQTLTRKLGRYHLLEQIGGGGMGVVHKARGPAPLDRIVALKQLRGGKLANPEEIQRFSLEAKVAGGLRHPNILPIYELGEHDNQLFLTMPHIAGGSLAKHLARFRGNPRASAQLMEKISRAVHFLHANGILHRDLKPSNILLDEHDEPLVTDFGLAKLLDDADPLTETGRVMGTPAYLSPEQAAGRNRQVTAASDVWALGVILYEILTGKRPFASPDRDKLYDLVLFSEPPPPRTLAPKLDERLQTIVLKCLAKEPAERYSTAAGLADDLHLWLEGKTPKGRLPSWPARAWKIVRRRPVAAAVSVLACLAIGLGSSYVLLKGSEKPVIGLPKPDPLAEGLRRLQNGETVTWIDDAGPPLAPLTYAFGEGDTLPEHKQNEPFALTTRSIALLDLIPDPQHDHYRLRVEVKHADVLDLISGAGVTLAHRSLPTPEGVHHFFVVLVINEWSPDGIDPPGAALQLMHLLDNNRDAPDQRPQQLGGTMFGAPAMGAGNWSAGLALGAAAKTKPTSSLNPCFGFGLGPVVNIPTFAVMRGPNPWHQIVAEVTPEEIRIDLDGKALRPITWAAIDKRANDLAKKPQSKTFGLAVPPLGPRWALGLYVFRGQGAFRSYVIEPLPADK